MDNITTLNIKQKRCIAWNSHGIYNKQNKFRELINRYKLRVVQVSEAHIRRGKTHHISNHQLPSTIELAIFKNIPIINIQSLFGMNSDHNPITFDIRTNLNIEHLHSKPRWNCIKAKWEEYKEEINKSLKMKRDFTTTNKIEEQVSKVTHNTQSSKQ